MPQSVAVFGPNLRDQSRGDFVVHAAGCADCRKLRGEERFDLTVESRTEIVLDVYPPDDFGYDAETELDLYSAGFHFAPCVTVH